jgi:hypothetical protein
MTEDRKPVRVGDRYEHGIHRITVTGIHLDPYMIEYTRLDPTKGAIWASKTTVIPVNWTKVWSAPRPPRICVACQQTEADPGQVYCWDCAVTHAQEWAGLSEIDATAKMVSLIEKAEAEKR